MPWHRDLLFNFDYTWEGWEENTFTRSELKALMADKRMRQCAVDAFSKALHAPVEIHEAVWTTAGRPIEARFAFRISVNGETVVDDEDAELASMALTYFWKTGQVPEQLVSEYFNHTLRSFYLKDIKVQ